MNTVLKVRKLHLFGDIGWFTDEPFRLLHIQIWEELEDIHPLSGVKVDSVCVFALQIAYGVVFFGFELA